ncbi:ABC transporter ATP-binding protein/permease [Snodgrassella sp. CFCC 13594]|uniref:ABC transporter ATP-binding protein/permease n=1 Tax=Snodgrassella sp. CFCC 13594 TaxID=1775559 RepID=UPI00082A3673|nr:ABC transporter ATP-binding protein/permease [Snodgrassella sp. CFCC 13594]
MQTLKHFLMLAAPYWGSRRRWYAWALLAMVIVFALGIIQISVYITQWNKAFYDALADYQADVLPHLVWVYLSYIAITVFFVVSGNWLRKKLLFNWRTHLTMQLQKQWLGQHRHYRLQFTHEPDNPDQRIAEDVALLADNSIDLLKYFLMNAFKLVAFVTILWQMSGTQQFTLANHTFSIQGYLLWVALLYSILCTVATHFIGRKLKTVYVNQQHREADYRATLLRVRDHAEQIASYRGEKAEYGRLNRRFAHIRNNWQTLIWREFKLETFSATYLRVSMFIPIIATLPMYLAKTMTFGDMMQARSAFMNVQDGFGWFMDYYKRIMAWAAVVQRLHHFKTTLDHLPQLPPHTPPPPSLPVPYRLQAAHLHVYTPAKYCLGGDINLQLHLGEWAMIQGPSGTGKSTLLRTLAGLWPFYQGHYRVAGNRFLFVPQRPYLPIDTLRHVLQYPNHTGHSDERIESALVRVGLGALKDQLDKETDWGKCLSGGEQQRISIARILLQQPDILFLDEISNQLDAPSAIQLFTLIKNTLPNTTVLAISHQREISHLFSTLIEWPKPHKIM